MTIEFRCSQCNQLLRVPEGAAGKNARCPKCQALMVVPAAAGGDSSAGSPLPTALVVAPSAGAESPFSSTSAGPPLPRKPSLPQDNPYAAPAALGAGAYTVASQIPGTRLGLPWENEPQTFGCWFRTTGMILGSPTRAFATMRQYGGLGAPMLYGIYGLGMPIAAVMFLVVPVIILVAVIAGGNEALQAAGSVLVVSIAVAIGAVIYAVLVPTLGALISAAIYHVLLLIVGAARQGFETTFRVVSFAQGSLFWLLVIPYLGPTIMGIWSLVLLIIGLAQAHEVPAGKVALAIFLPVVVCLGAFLVALAAGIGIAISQQ